METATTTTTAMKLEEVIIGRETIKPSSPTPPHLRSFKFSLLDQIVPPSHTPIVLFYSNPPPPPPSSATGVGKSESDCSSFDAAQRERSQCLKKSLSEILTRFHPLAGRIKDHLSVDCNDAGADYVEARLNCTISDVLQQLKPETLKHFVSVSSTTPLDDNKTAPLLFVRATFLECGGMALGLSVSHKITDAAAFSTFIKAWADTALGLPITVVPDFTAAASFFPPTDHLANKPFVFDKVRLDGVSKRYVFGSSKISALKAKAASTSVPHPTRFEAVSALVWKCAMATTLTSRRLLAAAGAGGGGDEDLRRQPSLLNWGVNIRARLEPPLPQHSFGNMSVQVLAGHIEFENESSSSSSSGSDEIDLDLSSIVCQLRRGIEGFNDNYAKKLSGENRNEVYLKEYAELRKLLFGGEFESYGHISWCRFPFYESDFGWGKPKWASIVPSVRGIPGIATFLDTNDGEGVEAWVTLAEEDIPLFETNPDLLAFASFNPSAL